MRFIDFKQQFFSANTNKKILVQSVKYLFRDFEKLQKFLNQFEKEIKSAIPLLYNLLQGYNHLPKEVSQLNRDRGSFYPENLIIELNWQALGFIKERDIINEFIILKDNFEHHLILGHYVEAREVLDEIEKNICISFWSIENRSILDEYEFGSEKHWAKRNELIDGDNDVYVKIFGDWYSYKAEKRVSFFQFSSEFNKWFNNQGLQTDKYSDIGEYVKFKTNYFGNDEYKKLSFLMYKESDASLIDRYLMFIRICRHVVLTKNEEKFELLVMLKTLNSSIKDWSIGNILFVFDLEYSNLKDFNDKLTEPIDEYSCGNYLKAIELSKKYLCDGNSNAIELYEIYSKSLIEAGLDYSPITTHESIANDISKYYFDILLKKSNTDDALVDLIKLAYLFNNSSIGLHLYSFVSEELGWVNVTDYALMGMLDSKFICKLPQKLDS